MRIEVDPPLMLRLTGCALGARGQEFSGLGFCELEKDVVRVYDFVLLDVGSEVFTEIPASELLSLMQRPDCCNMKVWAHRHPVGNGIPGPHNWSGTDNSTIALTPLGGLPELVRWSASMVLTPGGWVGRIDNHLTGKTEHLEVFPSIRPAIAEIQSLAEKKRAAAAAARQAAEEALLEKVTARVAELEPAFLEDLGITPEDLVLMALEQAGIYDDELDLSFDEQVDAGGGWLSCLPQGSTAFPSRGSRRSEHG